MSKRALALSCDCGPTANVASVFFVPSINPFALSLDTVALDFFTLAVTFHARRVFHPPMSIPGVQRLRERLSRALRLRGRPKTSPSPRILRLVRVITRKRLSLVVSLRCSLSSRNANAPKLHPPIRPRLRPLPGPVSVIFPNAPCIAIATARVLASSRSTPAPGKSILSGGDRARDDRAGDERAMRTRVDARAGTMSSRRPRACEHDARGARTPFVATSE